MRSHCEFRSTILSDEAGVGTAPKGKTVAAFMEAELPKHGYLIERVYPEDWGWCVQIANSAFPLIIGCGHYEEWPDGHLCFIEPHKPYVRRSVKRITTVEVVESLATAMEEVLCRQGQVTDFRWWTEAEVARG